jgi:flagellar export protein FliJ
MSDRFTFRLGRLLALRARSQDRAAAELTVAQTAAGRIEAARTAAEDVSNEARLRTRPPVGEARAAGEGRAMHWLSQQADARVAALAAELALAEAEAEKCREELQLRTRDRRVLERLKERMLETWREDAVRRDQHLMDDIALRMSTTRLSTRINDETVS